MIRKLTIALGFGAVLSLTACEKDEFNGETISKYSELGQCMLRCYETSQGEPAPEEVRIVE